MDERHDFYANSVNVTTSVYDVSLQFRTQSAVSQGPGSEPVIEASSICNVRMSPQHAKSLAALLVKHTADYENQHGLTLPVPENIQEIWNQYIKAR